MNSRDLARELRKAGLRSLAERAQTGEFGRGSPHQFPMAALETALVCRAVTNRKADALLSRLRRGEFK